MENLKSGIWKSGAKNFEAQGKGVEGTPEGESAKKENTVSAAFQKLDAYSQIFPVVCATVALASGMRGGGGAPIFRQGKKGSAFALSCLMQ